MTKAQREIEKLVWKHAGNFPHPVLGVINITDTHVMIVDQLEDDLVTPKHAVRYKRPTRDEVRAGHGVFRAAQGSGVEDFLSTTCRAYPASARNTDLTRCVRLSALALY